MLRTEQDIFKSEPKNMYVLKNYKRGIVWHEQYYSYADAKAKIEEERKSGKDVSGWEIDVIYPKIEKND